MTYTPVVITADNITEALNENFKRILEELRYKVPTHGTIRLLADWNMGGNTVLGVLPAGVRTAYSLQPSIDPLV
jgi:hypothetical protein